MANRYWVGGTGTWNSTASTKWATTSGGAGGASVPTASDDVFFDGASGAITVTSASTTQCYARSINFTGFTGTFVHASSTTINVGDGSVGHLTLVAGMTYTRSSTTTSKWLFVSTTTGNQITWAGKITGQVTFNGAGGGWTLMDDMRLDGSISTELTLTAGTLNTNGKSIIAGVINISGTSTRVLTLGASQITCGTWTATDPTNLTLNVNTSKITVNGATTFNGGGKTYNEVECTGAVTTAGNNTFAILTFTASGCTLGGNNTITTFNINGASETVGGANSITTMVIGSSNTALAITGSNMIGTFTNNASSAQTITFTDGTTQTITNMTCSGTAGNIKTLKGSATAGWAISMASQFVGNYLDVSYLTVSGGGQFILPKSSVSSWGYNYGIIAYNAYSAQKEVFTTSGTFRKNPLAVAIEIICMGAGGNGGQGNTTSGGTVYGGTGGGGGARNERTVSSAELANFISVIVAVGGAGSAGTPSSFGDLLYAYNGGNGLAGQSSGALGGGGGGTIGNGQDGNTTSVIGGLPATTNGANGFAGQGAGNVKCAEWGGGGGDNYNKSHGGSSLFGGGAGGTGGESLYNNQTTAQAGSDGGRTGYYTLGGGGAKGAGAFGAGNNGTNGTAGTSRSGSGKCGDGGGGGGNSTNAQAGVGGAGGLPSGGGGGGGSTYLGTWGAGGAGARGEVIVIQHF